MREKALHIDGTPQPKLMEILGESYAQKSFEPAPIIPVTALSGKKKKGFAWTTDEEERDEVRRRAFYPRGELPQPHVSFPDPPVSKTDPVFRGQEMKPTDDTATDAYKKKLLEEQLVVSPQKRDTLNETVLMHSLRDVYLSLISQRRHTGIISPKAFMETLRQKNEMFRQNIHHDAHEFLNYVLNSVHDGYAHMTNKDNIRDLTFVHDIFEGTLASEVRCLTCENVTSRDESFLDLSLDIEENTSVSACMRAFSASEFLREKNKFFCEACNGLVEAERRMKIRKLPKVLALHLKRFKFEPELQRHVKLQHVVRYDLTLRIGNTTDDASDPDRLFELYAVVVHLGGASYHGHYIACVRTEHLGWILYDDEHVERIPESVVMRFIGGDDSGTACAYVLFYRTVDVEESLEARACLTVAKGGATESAAKELAVTSPARSPSAAPPLDTLSPPVTHQLAKTPSPQTLGGAAGGAPLQRPAQSDLSPPQAAVTRKSGLTRSNTNSSQPPKPPPARRMISAVFASKTSQPSSAPATSHGNAPGLEIRHPPGTAGAAQQRSATEPVEHTPEYSFGPSPPSGKAEVKAPPARPGLGRMLSETYHGSYTQTQITSMPLDEDEEAETAAEPVTYKVQQPSSVTNPTVTPSSTMPVSASMHNINGIAAATTSNGARRPGLTEKKSSLSRFSSFRTKRASFFGGTSHKDEAAADTHGAEDGRSNGHDGPTAGNGVSVSAPQQPEKAKRRSSVFGLGSKS